jgi:D-alanyl-D-alanine carboxypeptidase (penicillin-binding protein 5/6)
MFEKKLTLMKLHTMLTKVNSKLHDIMNTKAWKYIPFIFILSLAIAGVLLFPETTSKLAADEIRTPRKNHFANLSLQAKAAYVYDMNTHKALYSKNETTVLPLASLTKVMTAVTALEQAPTSTIITIQKEHLAEDGDSGLLLGEHWSLENILKFTLVVSSNDGAAAVASSLGVTEALSPFSMTARQDFIKKMNSNAARLGLTKMWFTNESGLDQQDGVSGGYASAYDMAHLFEYALNKYRSVFEPTKEPLFGVVSEDGIVHNGRNTNVVSQKIPGLIAGKTGYTELAGGNLAIVFEAKPKHPVIVVVLGSTYDGRFSDITTLAEAAIAAEKDQ